MAVFIENLQKTVDFARSVLYDSNEINDRGSGRKNIILESLFAVLDTAGHELALVLISMIPLIELRGAVPLGIAAGLPWIEVLPLCYLGNLLPIPFVILFAERLLAGLSRLPLLRRPATWYTEKLNSKKGQVTRYAKWGLFIFVAIPLPGTGAWSGAAIAALLKMNPWRAFLAIAGGVVTAGIIMAVVSSGLFGLLGG